MTLQTPTTQDVSNNITAQMEASLNQTVPNTPRSFLNVLAKALSAVTIQLYKYGGFIFQQLFVQTASDKATTINGTTVTPLIEWGRLVGVGDPLAGTQAEVDIDITVTASDTLPAGAQLVGVDNGVTYLTVSSVAVTPGVQTITVRASGDQSGGNGVGAIGNLEAGQLLNFANPFGFVEREATAVATVVTGADAESTSEYRTRILDRFQNRPQGGALADYQFWSNGVAGVANSYPYTSPNCGGQVDIYVEADTSIDPDGIAPPSLLQEVLDANEYDDAGLPSRRPAGALVNTLSITRTEFNVEVAGLIVDPADQAQVQADIEQGLTEYLLTREPFIRGLVSTPRRDTITQSEASGVVADIVSANNGTFSTVFLYEGPTLIDQRQLNIGEKAKAGIISFIL